jgi:hypothetical protein
MPDFNSQNRLRYMKISQKSGCISADYNLTENDMDSEIVPYDDYETSGFFRKPRGRA